MTFQTLCPQRRHDRGSDTGLARRIFRTTKPSTVSVHPSACPDRSRVEAFVEAAYSRAFRSVIRSHYPVLISLRDGQDSTLAAAGFRFAHREPLPRAFQSCQTWRENYRDVLRRMLLVSRLVPCDRS